MKFFGKKEKTSCSCGEECNQETIQCSNEVTAKGAIVKILGSGCAKCNQLEENTIKALESLGIDTKVDHVTDFTLIASYGVMTTPALVYNGKVLSYGKVLKTEDIITLIKKEV